MLRHVGPQCMLNWSVMARLLMVMTWCSPRVMGLPVVWRRHCKVSMVQSII